MKRKWMIVSAAAVVLTVGGLAGWQLMSPDGAVQAQEMGETAVVHRGTLDVTVEGAGSIAPVDEVALGFLTGGRVADVLVTEGQKVEAGQPLMRLESDDLALEVARARVGVAKAEAQLAQLVAPPRRQEVAAREADLAAAENALAAAVANLDDVLGGPSQAQIASAQAQVAQAELQYRQAVINYDQTDKKDQERKEQARMDLWAAEVSLNAAKEQLSVLLDGPGAEEVRAERANVANAQAQRDAARSQLALLLAGATEENVAAARAQVAQARATLQQAQLQLKRATLVAPMAGTVTGIEIEAGEMAAPGVPAVVLSDLTALEVEVNVDETDVANVALGQPARISVDAFPDARLSGEVTHIAPAAASLDFGAVVYPVTVRLEAGETPVRTGMTADVVISVARREDVLIVPLRSVQVVDGRTYVNRVLDGEIEGVDVVLGLTSDTEAEIVEGLAEGDVVLVGTPAAERASQGFRGLFGGG